MALDQVLEELLRLSYRPGAQYTPSKALELLNSGHVLLCGDELVCLRSDRVCRVSYELGGWPNGLFPPAAPGEPYLQVPTGVLVQRFVGTWSTGPALRLLLSMGAVVRLNNGEWCAFRRRDPRSLHGLGDKANLCCRLEVGHLLEIVGFVDPPGVFDEPVVWR